MKQMRETTRFPNDDGRGEKNRKIFGAIEPAQQCMEIWNVDSKECRDVCSGQNRNEKNEC